MAKKNASATKVTRIKASDGKVQKAPKELAETKPAKKTVPPAAGKPKKRGIIGPFFGYFKGAWQELRQVHWPTRRATWGLTAAVLLFSAFFVVFITVLDALFKFLFEQILR